MGFGDSFKRIKNKLTRAQSGVADAESKGDEAQAEETKEAELETGEHKEVNKFIGGFRRETRLVQQIAQTHASKYSLAKVLSSRSASTRNLNIASKKLMSVLKQTGRNIQLNLRKAQWAAGGVSALPAAKKDIELLVNQKGKLIQNLSNETAITVKKLQADLASGKVHSFTGPIYDQKGNLMVAEGKTADDGMLAGMMTYVKGVEGDIPK